MSYSNHSSPLSFILTVIPGAEDAQFCIAFPFRTMYFSAVLGNITLLLGIRMDPSLHLPMFYFLSVLAAIDVVLTASTMPKLLSIFWFCFHEIDFEGCVAQIFFIHSFSTVESGVLLTVAFDRYLAICNLLCYSDILIGPTIATAPSITPPSPSLGTPSQAWCNSSHALQGSTPLLSAALPPRSASPLWPGGFPWQTLALQKKET
ncbi:olfactory receptor 52K2-like [Grus japonensis]|uniref:Olfactory receptor 52K2-like n=1 Tax=Grus japonensis TaxID=30415 RepID=A0ABC9W6E5_GRUJA